jgi:hypothetical protein
MRRMPARSSRAATPSCSMSGVRATAKVGGASTSASAATWSAARARATGW